VTYLPDNQIPRWAYAGHPPLPWLHDGRQLAAPRQGMPPGLADEPAYAEDRFALRSPRRTAVHRRADRSADPKELFGLDRVNAAIAELPDPTPSQAVDLLRRRVAELADGPAADDLCLAGRIG
jgi:stage II sporulation SpoE-like protein